MLIDYFESGIIIGLILALVLGLFRVFRGPGDADRLISVMLVGTSAIAIFLVLGNRQNDTSIFDIALVFALLAPISTIGFLVRGQKSAPDTEID